MWYTFVSKRDAIIEKPNRISEQWIELISRYSIVHNLGHKITKNAWALNHLLK